MIIFSFFIFFFSVRIFYNKHVFLLQTDKVNKKRVRTSKMAGLCDESGTNILHWRVANWYSSFGGKNRRNR